MRKISRTMEESHKGSMSMSGYAKGGKFGDPTKLTAENFSHRAKRAVLRGDEAGTYKKGGMAKGCYAGGGMVDRAAVRGKTKGKIY